MLDDGVFAAWVTRQLEIGNEAEVFAFGACFHFAIAGFDRFAGQIFHTRYPSVHYWFEVEIKGQVFAADIRGVQTRQELMRAAGLSHLHAYPATKAEAFDAVSPDTRELNAELISRARMILERDIAFAALWENGAGAAAE